MASSWNGHRVYHIVYIVYKTDEQTSAIVRRLFNLLKMLDINWCMLEKYKYYPHATGLGHGETCQARHRAVVATLCITARIIMVSIIFTLGHGFLPWV